MKIKILHILNDDKFIDSHISNIQKGDFQNTFVYLKEELTYDGKFRQLIKHIKPYSKEYDDLIRNCSNYQILILYYLSKDKANIINRINGKKPVIIWSFYGGDLYSLPEFKTELFSIETLKILNPAETKSRHLLMRLKNFLRPLYYKIRKEADPFAGIRKAIYNIDYFSWYDKGEYDYLNKKFNNMLPQFLESVSSNSSFTAAGACEKPNGILLGNSGSPFNNHIDILLELEKMKYQGNITIPLNYGSPSYISKLKEELKFSKLNIAFLEEFLPYKDYIALVNKHSAAVFNSYRQMALGNIFIALKCGLKVYLSKKNPSYQWLKKIGFHVYSIECDLSDDLKENNLRIPKNFADVNSFIRDHMGDSHAKENYLLTIGKITKKHENL